MDKTAQELASKGRYGDSMLVHMAPEEVAGIASLGGVSMNPETGLPEMFKFKDFKFENDLIKKPKEGQLENRDS